MLTEFVQRLARAIKHFDERWSVSSCFNNPCVRAHETCFSDPPIHQVVFYQSGIGTENLYDKIVDGEVSFNIV